MKPSSLPLASASASAALASVAFMRQKTSSAASAHPILASASAHKRRMQDPPGANPREALKDPLEGVTVASLSSEDAEILNKLVVMSQNPSWKGKLLLTFLSGEPSDGELKPAATVASTMEANAGTSDRLDGLDRSHRLDGFPETVDVATHTISGFGSQVDQKLKKDQR